MKAEDNFEQIVKREGQVSFLGELWGLMRQRRKYWMIPLLTVLLLMGVLVFLSGTAAAPFIYTLF